MGVIKWKSLMEQRQEEEILQTAKANKLTIEEQALLALEKNRTFLTLTSPTNAQTLAEVKALARQNNAIIRLLLNKLDGID